jgi:O-antigen/teichoic acid export membrane protein
LQSSESSPSKVRRVAESFFALASGDALARVIAFLAAVYVARRLGAAMFGVIAFANAVILYFTHLATCGVDLVGVRDVAEDRERALELAPQLLTVRLAVSAALIALVAAASLAFLPRPESTVLALYALTLFGHGPNPRFVLLGLSKPAPVAVARTLGEAVYLALVLALVAAADDIAAVPVAQAAGDVAAVLTMALWLKRLGVALPVRVAWSEVKPVLARSLPLVAHVMLGLLIYNSDLIVLRIFRDSATVGWYAAAYQPISFLINMSWAYGFSLLPSLTQARAETGERRELFHTSVAHTFAVGLPIAVGTALVAPQIVGAVFGAKFEPSAAPLAVLIASLPFFLYKDVALVALVVAGRERAILRMTAIAVAFNLALNFLVIPRFGMAGAAATTLATEVLRMVLAILALRREGMPVIPTRRLAKSAAAAGAMALALVLAGRGVLWFDVPLGAIVYVLALALLGGISFRRGSLPALRM